MRSTLGPGRGKFQPRQQAFAHWRSPERAGERGLGKIIASQALQPPPFDGQGFLKGYVPFNWKRDGRAFVSRSHEGGGTNFTLRGGKRSVGRGLWPPAVGHLTPRRSGRMLNGCGMRLWNGVRGFSQNAARMGWNRLTCGLYWIIG